MRTLETVQEPYLHVLLANGEQFEGDARRLRERLRGYVVRQLDGNRMRTERQLFAEMAVVLNFPSYFGHNWNALDECLQDFAWLPAAGYILLISNASAILDNERKWANIFFDVIHAAGKVWSAAEPPKPFHAVLGCLPEFQNVMQERLGAACYDLRTIE